MLLLNSFLEPPSDRLSRLLPSLAHLFSIRPAPEALISTLLYLVSQLDRNLLPRGEGIRQELLTNTIYVPDILLPTRLEQSLHSVPQQTTSNTELIDRLGGALKGLLDLV